MKTLKNITILAALGLFAQSAFAELTAEQAASLGGDKLTPIGAERAGNAAGTIPAWTGGLTKMPAGYTAGEPLVDPFPNEKPLFTITAQNFEQYKANLSAGQIALLKRYPDTFRMPVYTAHRTAAYPTEIYEAIKKDAITATTTDGGNVSDPEVGHRSCLESRASLSGRQRETQLHADSRAVERRIQPGRV